MSIKISDRVTPEGRQFAQTMAQLKQLEVRVGLQYGPTYENGMPVVEAAAINEFGTSKIPARPFMRDSVDNHTDVIYKFLKAQKQRMLKGATAHQILEQVGVFQKGLIQEEIKNGDFVENAPSTIAKKGSDKPLIDTALMRQSINYVIKQIGEE